MEPMRNIKNDAKQSKHAPMFQGPSDMLITASRSNYCPENVRSQQW
jgi:hypothetical protein